MRVGKPTLLTQKLEQLRGKELQNMLLAIVGLGRGISEFEDLVSAGPF